MIDHRAIAGAARAAGVRVPVARVAAGEARARPAVDRALAHGAWTEHPDLFGLYMDLTLRGAGVRAAADRRRAVAAIARAHRRLSIWRRRNPEALPFLRALRRLGVPFGVVSNSDGNVDAYLRRAGLLRHVPFLVDSGRFGIEKPDPRIFLEGCRRLGLPPRDVAYIGDIPSVDCVGARRAGLIPYLYDPPGIYRRRGARGGRRIERLREVLADVVLPSRPPDRRGRSRQDLGSRTPADDTDVALAPPNGRRGSAKPPLPNRHSGT